MAVPTDRKLGFQVVFASGEDPEYPATELNFHSPQTKGWQSPRFCEYPQEIGIQFLEGVCLVSQMQFLSHQSKIATRIEIFTGVGNDYFRCPFTRLGYLSLDSNTASGHKARELKTVFAKARCNFVKLLFHQCYMNPLNLLNQVGIVAINVLGSPAPLPGGPGGRRGAAGGPGGVGVGGAPGSGAPGVHDLAVDMGMDPDTAALLREVATRKEAAVAAEDFELAKRLKGLQEHIKGVGGTLAGLAADKQRAVEDEDYDLAARLKDEISRIRSVILDQMAALTGGHIGGGGHGGRAGGGGGGPGSGYYPPQQQQLPPSRIPAPIDHGGYGGPDGYMDAPAPSMAGGHSAAPMQMHMQMQMQPPGSIDRPIRPAAAADIYARAGASPARGGGVSGSSFAQPNFGSGGGAGSAEKAARSPLGGRPASRQIRPAKDNLVEEELAKEAEKRGGARSPGPPEQLPVAPAPGVGGGAGGGGGGERPQPSELDGVPGAADLPAPDPLSAAAEKEAGPLLFMFGEYVTRCYYSKGWNLREAAVLKMAHSLPSMVAAGQVNRHDALSTAASVIANIAAKERIAPVWVAAGAKLLPAVVSSVCGGGEGLRKPEVASTLEPVIAGLVEKMGDNTPKVREAAVAGFLELSLPEYLGAGHMAGALLRKPSKKQAGNTRNLQSRLEVLTMLVEMRNLLHASTGVSAEAVVAFCEEHGTFSHAFGDIRHATVELAAAMFKVIGRRLDPLLAPHLRPKQVEEYEAAYAAATGGVPPPPAAAAAAAAAPAPAAAAKGGKAASSKAGVAGAGGGAGGKGAKAASPPPAAHSHAPAHAHTQEEGEEDTGICQFCGGCGPGASEADLDVHYWRDCPLLMACPRCQQVIEIATLQEHLLTECERKGEYEACPTCGDAVLLTELDAHVAARKCAAPPEPSAGSRCSLCHADIGPDKEGWTEHLLVKGCPSNPRKPGFGSA